MSFSAESSAETSVSAGTSDPTLQDFVLNIINDEAAKAAYLANPTAALSDAGLADLTPADVEEVLPLVADSLPAGLPTDLSALPVGVPGLDDLPVSVPELGDLGDLPTGLPGLGALPVALPELGDLPAALPTDLGALPVAIPELGDLTGGLPVDVPAVGDLAGGLPVGVPALGDLTGGLPVDVPAVGDLTGGLPVGVPALGDLTGGLPVDVPAVGDLTGGLPVAVPELGDLTGGLPVDVPAVGDLTGGLPVGVPALGDLTGGLPVDVPAVGDLAGGLPVAVPELGDLTGGLPVDVPVVGDLAGGLPVVDGLELPSLPTLSTPVGDVTAVVDGVSGLASADLDGDILSSANAGLLSNSSEGDAPTLSSHTESILGDVAAGAKLAPEEFGGSVAGTTPLADFGGGLVGHVGGDFGAWAGADTVAGDVAAGVLAGQDGLAVAAESPLANLAVNSNGEFSVEPGNLNDLLDADNLGTTGDAVAGTVAHYVSTGANTAAAGVATGTDALGGYLTGSASVVGDAIDSTSATVTDGIQGGGDMVSEHLTNLPTTDGLPLDQLPELPQLPDLSSSDIPQVSDVTGHLPVDAPSLNLPDTSGLTQPVTDLVSHNPVTGVVGSTPVGGAVDGLTDHLSQVTDNLGHLDLGL